MVTKLSGWLSSNNPQYTTTSRRFRLRRRRDSQFFPAALSVTSFPNSGTLCNGIVRSGQNGTPVGLIENRGVHSGPRFGLAYNRGKAVFRLGGCVFFDRVTTFGVGTTSNYVKNPPTLVQSQILYGNLATIQSASTVNVPATVTGMSPDGHVPTVYKYSAGVQRELPSAILLDGSYLQSQPHDWLPQYQSGSIPPASRPLRSAALRTIPALIACAVPGINQWDMSLYKKSTSPRDLMHSCASKVSTHSITRSLRRAI